MQQNEDANEDSSVDTIDFSDRFWNELDKKEVESGIENIIEEHKNRGFLPEKFDSDKLYKDMAEFVGVQEEQVKEVIGEYDNKKGSVADFISHAGRKTLEYVVEKPVDFFIGVYKKIKESRKKKATIRDIAKERLRKEQYIPEFAEPRIVKPYVSPQLTDNKLKAAIMTAVKVYMDSKVYAPAFQSLAVKQENKPSKWWTAHGLNQINRELYMPRANGGAYHCGTTQFYYSLRKH